MDGIGTMSAMQNQNPNWQQQYYGQQTMAGQPMYSHMDNVANLMGNVIHRGQQAAQQVQQAVQSAQQQPQNGNGNDATLRQQVADFVKEAINMGNGTNGNGQQQQEMQIPGWAAKTGYVAAGAAGFWGLGKIKRAIFGGGGGNGNLSAQDGNAIVEAFKAFMR